MVNNWQEDKIINLCQIVNGKTPLRSKNEYWNNGNVAWFTIEDLRDQGQIINKTRQYITQVGMEKSGVKQVPENSILICCTASVGEYAFTKIPITTNQQFNSLVVKNTNEIIPEYLFQYSSQITEKLKNLMGKTTFGFVSVGQLGSIKIKYPDIASQQKIASILSTTDEEIQKTDQIIEKTEKLKNGLMSELLIKGIGHTKFKKTKIGEIPDNWSIESLSNTDIKIIDGDRGINYPKKDEFQNSGYCLFLSNKNIINDTFNFDESIFISQERDNLLRKGKLQKYDVVLTTRGSIGNVSYFDDSVPYSEIRINSGMLIFRAGKSFDPQFLYFLMKSSLMKKTYSSLGSGSAQPQLPISSLKNLQIAVPPIDEQRQIASIFQFFDDKYKNEKEYKKNLVNIKNGLMSDIFSQKVEVNE